MAVAHDEDLDRGVLDSVACVGAERAKRDMQRALAHDRDLRLGRPAARASARSAISSGGDSAHATPTWTSRKRAGAVPCETRMTWPGSPLPQLPTPHSRHSAAEQTASRPLQNVGVTPA